LRRWVEDQEDAKAMNKDEVRKARREEYVAGRLTLCGTGRRLTRVRTRRIEGRFKLQGFHPFECGLLRASLACESCADI